MASPAPITHTYVESMSCQLNAVALLQPAGYDNTTSVPWPWDPWHGCDTGNLCREFCRRRNELLGDQHVDPNVESSCAVSKRRVQGHVGLRRRLCDSQSEPGSEPAHIWRFDQTSWPFDFLTSDSNLNVEPEFA